MKKLKLFTKIIAILIICVAGFLGIYYPWDKPVTMENKIKDYTLSKDLKGYREIVLNISDAYKVLDANKNVVGDTDSYDDDAIKSNNYTKSKEKVNSSDSQSIANYEKTKAIFQKRLDKLGIKDYNLSMDKNEGTIYIQIPEDENTDRIVSNITETGKVEIKDSKDSTKVLLTNDHFKQAKVMYNSTQSGTGVLLQLQFNDEGKAILKDLSENDYKKIENTTEENTASEEENTTSENTTNTTKETENNTKEDKAKKSDSKDNSKEKKEEEKKEEEKKEQKELTLYLSDSAVTTTSFDEAIVDGKINLSMGQASTSVDAIESNAKSASTVAIMLNTGVVPLKYNVDKNQYVKTDIKEETIKNIIKVVTIITAILLLFMIWVHKSKGVLATLSYIGFAALYLIIIRLFNVTISLEGILGGIVTLILNFWANMKLLKGPNTNKQYYKQYLDVIMKLAPILAISIIFIFIGPVAMTSLGMTLFWGISLILAYNVAVTKHIVN